MGDFGAKIGRENTEKWGENASNFRNLARKCPPLAGGDALRASPGEKGAKSRSERGGPGAEERGGNRDAGRAGRCKSMSRRNPSACFSVSRNLALRGCSAGAPAGGASYRFRPIPRDDGFLRRRSNCSRRRLACMVGGAGRAGGARLRKKRARLRKNGRFLCLSLGGIGVFFGAGLALCRPPRRAFLGAPRGSSGALAPPRPRRQLVSPLCSPCAAGCLKPTPYPPSLARRREPIFAYLRLVRAHGKRPAAQTRAGTPSPSPCFRSRRGPLKG